MKKISVIVLPLVFLFASAFNPSATGNSEKVLQVFSETFKDVQNLKWYIINKEHLAYFSQNGVRTKIAFDDNGKFLRSRRNYSEEYLPLNILCKIKEKYNGKVINGITEVIEGDEILYSINIEDEKNSWVIEAFPNGNVKQILKFKKQLVK
ncbi:MAG: hypothetical protein JWQ09_4973 [Segetibacter sp.]|nr:hypothetical protein [Segetibacter sp.]